MHVIRWMEHYSVAVVFVVFVLIAVTTYWPGRRAAIERNGRIPLDDEPQGVPHRADQG